MTEYRGSREGPGVRIAIVAARFNGAITERLIDGAMHGLAKHGVPEGNIDLAWVPGAFEIPLVARRFADSGHYDAIICLGAVIRGETAHFELVAGEAASGIARVSADTGVPCIFEVLATEHTAQAESRAGGSHGNKGWDAAEAALEMVSLLADVGRDLG